MDYVRILYHVSRVYAIDPYLLEFILYNKNLSFTKFKSAVERMYRFTTVTNENGTILIRGLVNQSYQTVFVNDRLFNDCKMLIDLINRSEDYYKINGKKSSLYELMLLFNSFEPKNITRYKGLGEMPAKMLGISTVIPGMGRTLKQYTITDVKKELKLITELQDDKAAFIKGIQIKKEDII